MIPSLYVEWQKGSWYHSYIWNDRKGHDNITICGMTERVMISSLYMEWQKGSWYHHRMWNDWKGSWYHHYMWKDITGPWYRVEEISWCDKEKKISLIMKKRLSTKKLKIQVYEAENGGEPPHPDPCQIYLFQAIVSLFNECLGFSHIIFNRSIIFLLKSAPSKLKQNFHYQETKRTFNLIKKDIQKSVISMRLSLLSLKLIPHMFLSSQS